MPDLEQTIERLTSHIELVGYPYSHRVKLRNAAMRDAIQLLQQQQAIGKCGIELCEVLKRIAMPKDAELIETSYHSNGGVSFRLGITPPTEGEG